MPKGRQGEVRHGYIEIGVRNGRGKGGFHRERSFGKIAERDTLLLRKNAVKIYRLRITMQQAADKLGKKSGIFTVCDGGFAKALAKGEEDISADINDFYSEI